MGKHFLQSEYWQKFKNDYGTPAIIAGDVLYTVHKIPFSNYNYAYCPRVNPLDIKFNELEESLKQNGCIAVHFDVPNIIKGSTKEKEAVNFLKEHCVVSQRDEFAKANFFIDLTKSEEELLNNMHKKHKYNVNYAQRNGVTVIENSTKEGFEKFYALYKETGQRQKFYFRSHTYLEKLWDVVSTAGLGHILIAEHEEKPLAAWLLINYDGVLYYPYGGSTEEKKNVFASNLLGWETIKLGKKLGCSLFDMWGASEDLNDEADSYHGFSIFKSKFGAQHVLYINSYDLVLNPPLYKIFTTANDLRWKLLNILR